MREQTPGPSRQVWAVGWETQNKRSLSQPSPKLS